MAETEETVARDSKASCPICRGLGWHWGWVGDCRDPAKLRCPCVDAFRARRHLASPNHPEDR